MWHKNYECCIKCGNNDSPYHGRGLCRRCYTNELNKRLGAKQSFTCEMCGVVFSPDTYASRPRKYCSLACSKEASFGKPRGKYKDKASLVEYLQSVIKKEGRYLPMVALIKLSGVSQKKMNAFNVSVIELHRSVGIKKKKMWVEDIAYYHLKELIPDLEYNYVFPDCRGDGDRPLRFDLYSPSLNLIIEIDGPHHTSTVNTKLIETVKKYDLLKERYVRENGIQMLRVRLSGGQKFDPSTLEPLLQPYFDKKNSANHNVISNDDREGLKIVELEAISSQAA